MSSRDLSASVRQRLLDQARSQGRPCREVLQYFTMERFLYRLAKSPFADRFILKGAHLLTAWKAPVARPTMDIDLLEQQLEHIRSQVGEVCLAFGRFPQSCCWDGNRHHRRYSLGNWPTHRAIEQRGRADGSRQIG